MVQKPLMKPNSNITRFSLLGNTLFTMKTVGTDGFTSKFYQSFDLFYQGTNLIPQYKEKIVLNSFYETIIPLTARLNKNITRKESYRLH